MIKRVRQFARLVFLIGALLFVGAFCNFNYFSPDARYARDNLEYLSSRMEAAGILGSSYQIQGFSQVFWPLPRTARQCAALADAWVRGYLSGLGEEGLNHQKDLSEISPYDPLSRLVLTGNSEAVRAIYQTIQFDAAVCNPDQAMNETILSSWLTEKEGYNRNAKDACWQLTKDTVFLLLGAFLCTVGFLSLSIPTQKALPDGSVLECGRKWKKRHNERKRSGGFYL